MTALRYLPLAMLVAGGGLIVAALLGGGASLALVVIVPVVTGGSALFLLGVLLVVLGFATLPFVWEPAETDERGSPAPGPPGEGPPSGGGLLLVGPVPIFFGSMRPADRRTYWLAVGAGLVLTVLALGLFLVFR